MTEIHIERGSTGYRDVLNHIIRYGDVSSPRGLRTVDAGHVTMVLESPYAAFPLHTGRGVSKRIAAAEAVQLIGGFSLPRLLPASFDRFQEDDGSFWGAYGRRIGDQLAAVVRKLRGDRDTRQAIITLWSPVLDNVEPPKRDHPCTVALGFRVRRDQLTLHVTMRSSDAWLGIPYDWAQFTQLQLTVANVLQVEPGPYYHTSWSLHLYDQHVPLVGDVHAPTRLEFQPVGFSAPNGTIADVQERAWRVANGRDVQDLTESERWYADVLEPHTSVMG